MANAKKQLKVSDEVAIQITKMNKWFGSFHVLRDIDLTVNRGERIVIAGPSGSGKSTLIRCINRLVEPTSGHVYLNDVELTCLSTSALESLYPPFLHRENIYQALLTC